MRYLATHRFLLRELVRRDLHARYAGSAGGFLWSFAHPLVSLALYTFVFSLVLRVRVPGASGTESFALFLFAGLLPWLSIQEGVARGATAIVDNATFVKKLAFPPEVLIASIVLASLLHQAVALGVFAVVLAVLGKLTPGVLVWLVAALPLQVALTHGLSCLLAATHVFFRDTAQVLGALLMVWFYTTPIVFPATLVPASFRGWIDANPLTHLVACYRAALLGQPPPTAGAMLYLTLVAGLVCFAGVVTFRRLQAEFPDLV